MFPTFCNQNRRAGPATPDIAVRRNAGALSSRRPLGFCCGLLCLWRQRPGQNLELLENAP